jgi:LmbE family N-acetylglucosaminyl deacetylase
MVLERMMEFNNPGVSVFVPDGRDITNACSRTTHLGIGTHQDDLEILALHGIKACYKNPDLWFGGVVCTDGIGSPRTGLYANYSPEEFKKIRHEEQKNAATLGKYSFVIQLDYSSQSIKHPADNNLEKDILKILANVKPGTVYTHNPADKHETHIGTVIAVIRAIRKLPPEERPEFLYGCEVWRNLDWLLDQDKVAFDTGNHEKLGERLLRVFESQIKAGKRYDVATLGRRQANATFFQSHDIDKARQLIFAMDLSPLIKDISMDILEYVLDHVRRFQRDVETKLKKYLGR